MSHPDHLGSLKRTCNQKSKRCGDRGFESLCWHQLSFCKILFLGIFFGGDLVEGPGWLGKLRGWGLRGSRVLCFSFLGTWRSVVEMLEMGAIVT